MSLPSSPLVTAAWLSPHLNDENLLVIDVRPRPAYLYSHIPGAFHLDVAALRLPTSDEATIAAWAAHIQKAFRATGITAEQRVVFYEDVSGTLAAFGVWLLDAAGLGNGSLLDGGLRAWTAAGLGVSRDPATPVPSTVEVSLDRAVIATASGIISLFADGQSAEQLVDTRGTGEYVSGTIPGSTHVEWVNHLTPIGQLKTPEELQAIYADAGVTPDKPTITYCAGGFRAAHTYVALRVAGFTDVSTYAPSWSEWAQLSDAPIEHPDET